MVGVFSVICVLIIGVTFGALAGFFGGWVDTFFARLGDIFFALPDRPRLPWSSPSCRSCAKTAGRNSGPGPGRARLAADGPHYPRRRHRGAQRRLRDGRPVARCLPGRSLVSHVLPNALAPIIVLATMELGVFIVAEATLSFLGIGMPGSVMSWGNDISAAQASIRTNPAVLLYPATALSITVLSFIMLGDALRDALDPKSRQR